MKLSAVLAAVLLCVFIADAEASVRAWPKDDPVRVPDTGLRGDELYCTGVDIITFASMPLTEYRSDTTVDADNLTEAYACEDWREDGGEVVYEIFLDGPALLTAQVTPEAGVDLDIFLLAACHSDSCLIAGSTAFSLSLEGGTYWLVVDGYHGDEGTFDLAVEARSTGVPDIVCTDLAVTIPTGQTDWADTSSLYDRENLLHSYDCSDTPAAGGEVWYRCILPAGATFEAKVKADSTDAALWLLTACDDGAPELALCLDASDETASGGRETVTWTNDTGAEASLVLAVDAYMPPIEEDGEFVLETTITRLDPICDVADPDLVDLVAAPATGSVTGDLSTATGPLFWTGCLDGFIEGAVAWYRITVPAGTTEASLILGEMTFDGALLRFSGCGATASCTDEGYFANDGVDGIDETLVFANTGSVEIEFYLAVVSLSTDPGGYTLSWGGFTPTQTETHGSLRRRFR